LTEFERDIIRERTRAGLESARRRVRLSGRPKGLSSNAQGKAVVAEMLYREGKLSVNKKDIRTRKKEKQPFINI